MRKGKNDLVKVPHLEAGLADDVAEVGESGFGVMFFLDDGCNPRNGVSEELAQRIVAAAEMNNDAGAVQIRKTRKFRIRLAGDDRNRRIYGTKMLVINKLRIEHKLRGWVELENVEFDILPGHGPELLIG